MQLKIMVHDEKSGKDLRITQIDIDCVGNVTNMVAIDLQDCDEDGYTVYYDRLYKNKPRFTLKSIEY